MTPPDHLSSWKVGRPYMSVAEVERDTYSYRIGHVITPLGVVGIYDQPATAAGDKPHTRLDMVVDGRNYSARWSRTFSDRYLKTLACRFARSVLDMVQ